MFARLAIGKTTLLRFPRKLIAVLILASYLFAGALHAVCDVDVTGGPGTKFFTSIKKDAVPEKTAHHCHGCFSVSVPSHVSAACDVEPSLAPTVAVVAVRSGLSPGIEPPLPKVLT